MTPRERYAVIAVFLFAVTAGLVFNLRQSAEQERTRIVLCGVVQEAAASEADRLAQYEAEPPQTLAGQAQQQAAERALTRWTSRADRLGCDE